MTRNSLLSDNKWRSFFDTLRRALCRDYSVLCLASASSNLWRRICLTQTVNENKRQLREATAQSSQTHEFLVFHSRLQWRAKIYWVHHNMYCSLKSELFLGWNGANDHHGEEERNGTQYVSQHCRGNCHWRVGDKQGETAVTSSRNVFYNLFSIKITRDVDSRLTSRRHLLYIYYMAKYIERNMIKNLKM